MFYETNNHTGDRFSAAVTPNPIVPSSNPILIPDESSHRIGLAGWKNDEARSMKIFRWPAGVRVRVCDSPNCETNGDWTDGKGAKLLIEANP
ncbi:hypothetical protein JJE73_04435 [Comamonas sp. JC664]|nr:hypothetical protein [Comamonas sp. JC664]GHG90856.1 hypothetical protein GCM10012319_51200 [Comamonas sp. KCTC 72670]